MWYQRARNFLPVGYLLLVAGFIAFHLLQWPIVGWDTDLWYHLSGGQYIAQHRALPRDTYFSFLVPVRPWVDYYWLFQLTVHLIYSQAGGYVGLILFRAGCYLLTWFVISRYLFSGCSVRSGRWWAAGLSILFAFFLLPRSFLVRPHLISYGFIPLFLYVLECRPRWVKWLPVLVVVWCNFHGIYYPAPVLIGTAYLAEYGWGRLRGQPYDRERIRTFVLPLVVALLAIFATPHGPALLRLPFFPMAYARSIGELQPVPLNELFSICATPSGLTHDMVISVLVLGSGVAVVLAGLQRRLRLAHALLWIGGLLFLWRGVRFLIDYVLLSLPVFATAFCRPAAAAEATAAPRSRAPAWVRTMFAMALMSLPLLFVQRMFRNRPHYPLAPLNLPQGVAAFLRHVPAEGPLLNFPNQGGYLRWVGFPQYRIMMDLELPPFTDTDFYRAESAFRDPVVLGQVIRQYAPSVIAAPIVLTDFPSLIAEHPEYRVVFFDEEEVLYLNSDRYPELAEDYAIRGLDPFALHRQLLQGAAGDLLRYRSVFQQHFSRWVSIYPYGRVMNHAAALLAGEQGDYALMRSCAERIVQMFPQAPLGYQLEADALRGLGMSEEAVRAYGRALRRAATPEQRAEAYRGMAWSYVSAGRFRDAYQTLRKVVDPLSPDTTPEMLYLFGVLADFAGAHVEAEAVRQFLSESRLAPDDPLKSRIDLLRERQSGRGAV
ncbi:MAG: tetratricopeptide repeat protein [Candidatus Omnitrophica bacterium]|nr:tetratricopeptide repeat protein [Candidatus Omnitrophota bacterium]